MKSKRISLIILALCTVAFANLKSMLQEQMKHIDSCGDELIQLVKDTPNLLEGQAEIIDAKPENNTEAYIKAKVTASLNKSKYDILVAKASKWASKCYSAVTIEDHFQESFSEKISTANRRDLLNAQIALQKTFFSSPSITIEGIALAIFSIGDTRIKTLDYSSELLSISGQDEIHKTSTYFEPITVTATVDISDNMEPKLSILRTTGKTVLGERRGKADGGLLDGFGGGGDGRGGRSAIGGKGAGAVKAPSDRDISMGGGDGSRSKADIMKVVKQRTPSLRHIYDKSLKTKPGFTGKVTLRFTIAPAGDIISIAIASSTTGYAEFDNQIKAAVAKWNFGSVQSGNTTVTIPFNFAE